MLLSAIYFVGKVIFARSLQVNKVQDGYDVISEFPIHHLSDDSLGKCIGEYMVVDKNANVALLCLKQHLEKKIAEARVSGNITVIDPMVEALRTTMRAMEIAKNHSEL